MSAREHGLDLKYIAKLNSLFENKGWNKDGGQFERFCERAKSLPDDESRDLFIELAEKFLWMRSREYSEILIQLLNKLFAEEPFLSGTDKIIVSPLLKYEDIKNKRTKSSHYVFRDIFCPEIRYETNIDKYRVSTTERPFHLRKELIKDSRTQLLLLDDFIGTGDTALEALKPFLDEGVPENQIQLLCLVTQKQGYEVLTNRGIRVVYSEMRGKGITDNYHNALDRKCKLKTMSRIERKMEVEDDFQYGYGSSEALVSVQKTPNNTFPVFWYEKHNAGKAPFPRGFN